MKSAAKYGEENAKRATAKSLEVHQRDCLACIGNRPCARRDHLLKKINRSRKEARTS